MKKSRQPNTQKNRDLQADWEKLLKKHSKPLNTKIKADHMNKRHRDSINRLANLHADRMPANASKSTFANLDYSSAADERAREAENLARNKLGNTEYERRQAEAKERKFTVLPLHKSNYVLVTDKEMVALMGKKVV